MQKSLKPWHMGTYLKVLSKSYLINTNMKRVKMVCENLCGLVLWTKVALALKGLNLYAAAGLFGHYKKMQKIWKNYWNPGTWVLIWEYSVRAIQWIPT